jgi:ribosomal protein S18 acetylase RimI-like enzyme
MDIRSATFEDAPIVAALIQELARSGGEISPITPEFVQTYLSNPASRILLAEEHGQVAGLLSYAAHPDLYHAGLCGEIEALVVSAHMRGKGVGAALLQEVLKHARTQGWAEVSVSTMPENQPAIEFYRKNGFGDEAVLLEQHLQE